MTDHELPKLDHRQAELVRRLADRAADPDRHRDPAYLELVAQLDLVRPVEPAVGVAHRQALAAAGPVITTIICGAGVKHSPAAVVRGSPAGPLWIAQLERPPDVAGDVARDLTGRRAPANHGGSLWLLDYEPADWLSREVWQQWFFPPIAVCARHGRLEVDPARIADAVARRRRICVLQLATN